MDASPVASQGLATASIVLCLRSDTQDPSTHDQPPLLRFDTIASYTSAPRRRVSYIVSGESTSFALVEYDGGRREENSAKP